MNLPTFEELFKPINTQMWLVGITGTDVHFRFYVIIAFYFPIILEEGGYFVKYASPENFVALAGLAPCICYCTISLIKIQVIFSKRSTVAKINNSVKELYQTILNNPSTKKSVVREIIFVQKLAKYLSILNYFLASVYNISSPILILYHYITSKNFVFPLPYPVIVPFGMDAWIPWICVYLHSITCAYICIICTMILDSLYFMLVTIICVNYSILCDDFMNLKNNNFKNINNCIQRHQYLIKLSEDVNELFERPNFFNLLFGAVQICALGFCLTAGEWADVPGYLIFLATVLAQIWTINIFGENIMSRSSKITEAISNSGWYEMDNKTMKTVLFVIARSQKPQKLTAYIFSNVCINSFRKIISNSWSYFSLLRSSYNAPDT